jgi:hypothetical protein
MMRQLRSLRAFTISIGFIAATGGASAQGLPAHTPGTICLTPSYYWCWVPRVGVGAPCACPSPYGPVPGIAQ